MQAATDAETVRSAGENTFEKTSAGNRVISLAAMMALALGRTPVRGRSVAQRCRTLGPMGSW